MVALAFTVPDLYPYILIEIAIIGFACWMIGFLVPGGKTRMNTFDKPLMENFRSEHENAFPGERVPLYGSPDMGSGYYSKELSYKEWFNYNVK